MTAAPVNLLGMPRAELEAWFTDVGEKPFRARQLMRWVYHRNVLEPDHMTDLSLGLRRLLNTTSSMPLPQVQDRQVSADGTTKWALAAGGGQRIEMVFIPETGRGTLCVSSQVGCALDCSFCATGREGFNRNLLAAEIVGQVMLARKELAESGAQSPVTNVVFMGMGEPLANMKEVVRATGILIDPLGLALSRRRVTISTSGLVPNLRQLAGLTNAALAVSLHAPDDALRDQLVPINRWHPIAELLEACWEYARATNSREVTFEYVMLDGVNDSQAHARRLASLLAGHPAKVNLIPFNPFPGTEYRRSPRQRIDQFRQVLLDRNIMTITRRTRGDDIHAACGQLAGRVENRVRSRLGIKKHRTKESQA